jgi:hypothetical protein
MLMWFLLFAWILVIGSVVADVFRSDDLGGLAKAGWVALVVFIPWLGVIIYLIARGESMAYRYAAAAGKRSRRSDTFWRGTSYTSEADALASLNRHREAGLVGGMDYDTQRARILG